MKKTMKHNLTAAAAAALLTHAAMAQVPPPPVSPTPVTTYEYDAEGSPTKVTKAPESLNLQNKASYDAQYRVKELTDPKNGKTAIEYDGGGRPTKVTDPRSLVTQYPRNGFGDATQLISPDTGITNITYDAARRLKTRTDSRGVTETYTYDLEGRLASVVYTQSGQPSQTITWSWDLTGPDYTYSIGRLSRTDHPAGFARVKYDPRGRITEAVQSVNAKAGANTVPIVTTVKYAYSHGDLMTITYPSGRVLVITRDVGELIGMSLAKDAGSTPVPLISNVKWEPFGPVSGWDWHMTSGLVPHQRQFDLSGRIVRYPMGNALRDVTYDAADRITGFTHLLASDGTAQPALDQSFGYDENSRLTSITTAASSWSIAYDPNGNRTSVSLNGSPSTYTTEATSNRLTSITNPARSFGYDNAGNTTSDSAGYTATYGLNGSVASITKAGVTGSYDHDAERRRIRKVTSTGETVIFVYDLEGQLLGEYDQTGKALREYVWLDNIPVAMFVSDPANPSNPPLVFYIHADHLNAPRIVVDQNGAKRWRWLAEPFGTTAPETNPEGLGVLVQNLRFPGQYADAESGLWYNYFRNYDPLRGYIQSDPIGLAGGSPSTYTYVDGNPLIGTDSLGLFNFGNSQQTLQILAPAAGAVGAVPALGAGAVAGGAVVGLGVGVGIGLGINAGVESLTGNSIGSILYDITHPDPLNLYPLSDKDLQKAIEKGANQSEAHRICDEPPPPGLDPCQLLRWNLTKQLRCKAARNNLSNKWFGGPDQAHVDHIKNYVDPAIQRLRDAIDRQCKPCPYR
ncbi:RHS repeat domain-containing protein [Rhizobacter sp. OV335]|uniref:RHS repeat domain-containing protein n=1 Tax=Rhizobacter sp. OV335 TaxID=1500264 RepID=UPI0009172425|nr:RHS repeat-associated core domain-containing protein [Rhizobacter sp. OV335]SHM29379.1 RHS repeat-associated core domain-containing protein [Rhizobacter sp. OV335]